LAYFSQNDPATSGKTYFSMKVDTEMINESCELGY